MEDGQMIEIYGEKVGEGFTTLYERDSRRVAMISYSEAYGDLRILKRHNETDEAFLLLSGKAILYHTEGDDFPEKLELSRNILYNVTRGTWHHLKISCDAQLLVIERAGTSAENTESREVNFCEDLK